MLFDIIALIVIIVFVIIGIKTGAAKVICRLLSVVCSFLIAVFSARFLAMLIYNLFIKQTIINNIDSIVSNSAIKDTTEKATELLNSFPAFLKNTLSYFGITETSFSALFDTSAVNSMENLIMTPVVGLISIVLFIVLFIVLLFLLKRIFKVFARIFRLPLIRVVDSALGFVFGLLEGLLVVYLIVLAVKLLIPLTGGNVLILNEAYVEESFFFSLLYFGGLTSFVQGFVYSLNNINLGGI